MLSWFSGLSVGLLPARGECGITVIDQNGYWLVQRWFSCMNEILIKQ
jgi:hypothetical protein